MKCLTDRNVDRFFDICWPAGKISLHASSEEESRRKAAEYLAASKTLQVQESGVEPVPEPVVV